MIVSIWNQNERDMSAAFTAALSITTVLSMPCSIVMLDGVSLSRTIGDVILDENYSKELKEETVYHALRAPGDGLAQYVSERYKRRIKSHNIIEIIYQALYYIPQFFDERTDVFDQRLCYELYSYIAEAESLSDFIVVNTAKSESMASVELLDDAERVIVLMKPNYLEFYKFVEKYRSILSKCCFVVFDRQGTCDIDIKNISQTLGIHPERIFVLPYTNEFQMYADYGNIYDYFRRYYRCNRTVSEFRVVRGFARISDFIFGRGYEGINLRASELTSIIQRKIIVRKKEERKEKGR